MEGNNLNLRLDKGCTIQFMYTNWKGEQAMRTAFVYDVYWGSNEWHTEDQWLLHALDEDKGEPRYFALKDMSEVVEIYQI